MKSLLAALAPLVVGPILFVAVLRSGPSPAPLVRTELPRELYDVSRCTWYCHDHGCRHRPHFPAFLTHDDALFGAVVRALYRAGRLVSPDDPLLGYGIANLVVFCAAWPGALYGLWLSGTLARARRLGDGA